MPDKPTVEELRKRIKRDIEHFGGRLPERVALAWSGYLAALIEWGLVSVPDFDDLSRLVPHIEDDPAVAILLGRPRDEEPEP